MNKVKRDHESFKEPETLACLGKKIYATVDLFDSNRENLKMFIYSSKHRAPKQHNPFKATDNT